MSPGKAAALLFVPFFNLYWCNSPLQGWTQDYNRFAAADGDRLPARSSGLAFFVSGARTVLRVAFIADACDGINALALPR